MLQESTLIDTRSQLYKLRRTQLRRILKEHGDDIHNKNVSATVLRTHVQALGIEIDRYLPPQQGQPMGPIDDPRVTELQAQIATMQEQMAQMTRKEPKEPDGVPMHEVRARCKAAGIKYAMTDKKEDLLNRLR